MFEDVIGSAIARLRETLVPELVGELRDELHGNTVKQNATLLYLALESHGGDDEARSSKIRRAVDLAIEIDEAVEDRLSDD